MPHLVQRIGNNMRLKYAIERATMFLEKEYEILVTPKKVKPKDLVTDLKRLDKKDLMDLTFLGIDNKDLEFFAADDKQLKDIKTLLKTVKDLDIKTIKL